MMAYLESEPRFTSVADELAREALSMALGTGLTTVDAFALILGTGISVATRFSVPLKDAFYHLYSVAIARVLRTFIGDLLRELLTKFGFLRLSEEEAQMVERMIEEAILLDPSVRAFISLLIPSRVDLSEKALYPSTGKEGQLRWKALDFDFAQTVSKLCGYDLAKLKMVGLVKEISADGKGYYPVLLEAIETRTGSATLKGLLTTLPGRSIFATWVAVRELGSPETRARSIERRWREELGGQPTRDELKRTAAMGLFYLSLLSDEEILSAWKGTPSALPSADATIVRNAATETLKFILEG